MEYGNYMEAQKQHKKDRVKKQGNSKPDKTASIIAWSLAMDLLKDLKSPRP